MANTLSVDQITSVLRAVLAQSVGLEGISALDTAAMLTVGQKALKTGADPVIGAIANVISKTVFSAREYKRKFPSIMREAHEWGNIVRKIAIVEDSSDLQNNKYIPLEDGVTVDQYRVKKPKALELNFYGQQTYEIVKTIFDTQLNTAFNSAEEFGRFISMVFVYVFNKIEKIHEETARATVAGFVAGKIRGDSASVVHLLTEYRTLVGNDGLTVQDIYKPENFGPFMKWAYSRVEQASNMLTEYSAKNHVNVGGGVILRHTPKEDQLLYLYAPIFYQTASRVLADTYHKSFLELPGAEMVNYWQSIETPDTISVEKPVYIGLDGAVVEDAAALTQSNVFGVLFDREALGYSPVMERVKTSPYNAAGEYYNMFWKFNERHWLDFTENGVVFLLD